MVNKNVKKTMIDQNLTLTKLGAITGYSRVHLSNVINGHLESLRAKKVIALALRKDFRELWDDEDDTKT